MWALKMMPFSVVDWRIKMWEASIKEAKDLDFAIIKDGEWIVTNKGKIALTVLNTKYNDKKMQTDETASRLKEIHRGDNRHPGQNDGFHAWSFERLVKFMGFNKAMKTAIDYNSSILTTTCGQDFLILFKTHFLFESPDETFKCPARGPNAGKNEEGVHFRTWEMTQEAKGFSTSNGKIVKKYLIE